MAPVPPVQKPRPSGRQAACRRVKPCDPAGGARPLAQVVSVVEWRSAGILEKQPAVAALWLPPKRVQVQRTEVLARQDRPTYVQLAAPRRRVNLVQGPRVRHLMRGMEIL